MENHDFVVSKTPEGYVAAAISSPYFCFVGNSEAEVLAIVKRAVAFYETAKDSIVTNAPAPKPVSLTPLRGRRMSTRELMVA